MKVALLDGYNLIYRARYSFNRGKNATSFSFFRSLRALIERLDPDLVYFIIEGYPHERFELLSEYKANRNHENNEEFLEQKELIIDLLKLYFPVTVSRHPSYEADDVIANLAMHQHSNDECVVVSTDTDFLQLYNTCENVEIYNPIRKIRMEQPDYDYVKWKSLKGDSCDNISGIKGIGSKRAELLIKDSDALEYFLRQNHDNRKIYERNIRLIKFVDLEERIDEFETSDNVSDWSYIKAKFNELEFYSITNDKSWIKFKNTFSKLEKC